jgi:hypothetical protein
MSIDRISDRCGVVWEAEEDGRAAPSEPAEPAVPKTRDRPGYTVPSRLNAGANELRTQPREVTGEAGAPHDAVDVLSATWRVQPEGIPPLGAPRLTDPAPLQDNMIDATNGKRGTHREAGGSGAHDGTIHNGLARHDQQ